MILKNINSKQNFYFNIRFTNIKLTMKIKQKTFFC